MNDFYKLANEIHNQRMDDRCNELNSFEYNCKMLIVLFKVWCLAFEKDSTNYKNLNLFLKQTNKKATFWQKKYILEKEFAFKFCYDFKLKKWETSNE